MSHRQLRLRCVCHAVWCCWLVLVCDSTERLLTVANMLNDASVFTRGLEEAAVTIGVERSSQ